MCHFTPDRAVEAPLPDRDGPRPAAPEGRQGASHHHPPLRLHLPPHHHRAQQGTWHFNRQKYYVLTVKIFAEGLPAGLHYIPVVPRVLPVDDGRCDHAALLLLQQRGAPRRADKVRGGKYFLNFM